MTVPLNGLGDTLPEDFTPVVSEVHATDNVAGSGVSDTGTGSEHVEAAASHDVPMSSISNDDDPQSKMVLGHPSDYEASIAPEGAIPSAPDFSLQNYPTASAEGPSNDVTSDEHDASSVLASPKEDTEKLSTLRATVAANNEVQTTPTVNGHLAESSHTRDHSDPITSPVETRRNSDCPETLLSPNLAAPAPSESSTLIAEAEGKNTKTPSANRLSISYAGNRRLVVDAEVIEKLTVFRAEGRIEVIMHVRQGEEPGFKGIYVSQSVDSYNSTC
jgi:20S proteasome subunit alpha 6